MNGGYVYGIRCIGIGDCGVISFEIWFESYILRDFNVFIKNGS